MNKILTVEEIYNLVESNFGYEDEEYDEDKDIYISYYEINEMDGYCEDDDSVRVRFKPSTRLADEFNKLTAVLGVHVTYDVMVNDLDGVLARAEKLNAKDAVIPKAVLDKLSDETSATITIYPLTRQEIRNEKINNILADENI